MTSRILVWMFYHLATGNSWKLDITLGSCDDHPAHCSDLSVDDCHMHNDRNMIGSGFQVFLFASNNIQ